MSTPYDLTNKGLRINLRLVPLEDTSCSLYGSDYERKVDQRQEIWSRSSPPSRTFIGILECSRPESAEDRHKFVGVLVRQLFPHGDQYTRLVPSHLVHGILEGRKPTDVPLTTLYIRQTKMGPRSYEIGELVRCSKLPDRWRPIGLWPNEPHSWARGISPAQKGFRGHIFMLIGNALTGKTVTLCISIRERGRLRGTERDCLCKWAPGDPFELSLPYFSIFTSSLGAIDTSARKAVMRKIEQDFMESKAFMGLVLEVNRETVLGQDVFVINFGSSEDIVP